MFQGVRFKRILVSIIFILILIVSIHVTSHEREEVTFLERIIRDTISPLQSLLNSTGARVSDYFNTVIHVKKIKEENLHLTKEVSQLLAENNELRRAQKENERLRRMLGFKEETPYQLLPAKVIARDPSNWTDTIIIGVGEKDGVKKNMAVVTELGLVGHIISVTNYTARVLLLIDSRSAVGARLERSRDLVIVEGLEEEETHFWMKPLIRDVDVKEGDRVVSSGLGGIYPGELLIGEVIQVKTDEYNVTKHALIKPFVNFMKLEEVFVIIGPLEEEF